MKAVIAGLLTGVGAVMVLHAHAVYLGWACEQGRWKCAEAFGLTGLILLGIGAVLFISQRKP